MNSPDYAKVMAGLQGVAQHPIVNMAIRYWWLSIPVGYALYGKYQERKDKDEKIKLHHIMVDFSSVIGPVMSVVALSELATKLQKKEQLSPTVEIKDAEFKTQPEGAST